MTRTMPLTVLDKSSQADFLGLRFRRATQGPEQELVDSFLEHRPFELPRGYRLTIFREPRLESGFPDLVLVAWSITAAKHWNATRAQLSTVDLRLMHYLYRTRHSQLDQLRNVFTNTVVNSLERLEAAEMVRYSRGTWRPRPLTKTFAVRAIIAVEAKIRNWTAAIEQAFLNTWFASSSCVLLPSLPRGSRISDTACASGVDIWAMDSAPFALQFAKLPYEPRSYASWMFNEWTLRASVLGPR